jgi:hypothetical protein
VGVAMFISDIIDFKPKLVRRDKKGHFVLTKGMIKQEEIIIVNTCPNVGVPSFIK